MANFFDLTNGPDQIAFVPGQTLGRIVRGLDDRDYIAGSSDRDDFNGNRGDDTLLGGESNDYLRGGQGDDILNGNQGDDIVNGNLGFDIVVGGKGNDLLYGGQEGDSLFGGEGVDTLSGDYGTDFLQGDHGDDLFLLRRETATYNRIEADIIGDFGNGSDRIGLTGGLREADLRFIAGGDGFGYTPFDTVLQVNATGEYLGVVIGTTPGQLSGRFVTLA